MAKLSHDAADTCITTLLNVFTVKKPKNHSLTLNFQVDICLHLLSALYISTSIFVNICHNSKFDSLHSSSHVIDLIDAVMIIEMEWLPLHVQQTWTLIGRCSDLSFLCDIF